MMLKTNIDTLRATIMQLEAAPVFEPEAWERVLADLRAQGRTNALPDATRRMRTAWHNAGAPSAQPLADEQQVLQANPDLYAQLSKAVSQKPSEANVAKQDYRAGSNRDR